MNYDFKNIEKKWRNRWKKDPYFRSSSDTNTKKYYCLDMFPYPSGSGLHVGHWKGYVFSDVYARQKLLQGYNVLHPMGWDAFGLPAENAAIKQGVHPRINTEKNIANIKEQMDFIGAIYDWTKELDTTDPNFYKWTQWIFLQMYKAGLAYESDMPINWCPKCLTGLANEEVVDNACERCHTEVETKPIRQWVLKITAYAEKLLNDLDGLNWPEKVKMMQRNWIGKSEGLRFSAPIKDMDLTIETFSAHFESCFADTFVVIAPDHELLPTLLEGIEHKQEILSKCQEILTKRRERGFEQEKEVEGVFTGRYIVDPLGNGDLPIWVASFALADYGTGIVKCSAHDERDFAFAKKYDISLKPVLFPTDPQERARVENLEYCYSDMENGILEKPDKFHGMRSGDVREQIIEYCIENNFAVRDTRYRLRDWIFSRQRYWGEPIPLIHCSTCGIVPVPEKDLPVLLPDVEKYEPTGTGESPLADIEEWVNVACPQCDAPAKRETNTMPQWAGSCWYFLRYPDVHNTDEPFSKENLAYWLPVDMYVGGIEHAILHLLYARFYTKVLYDLGHISFNEPFLSLFNQGMVCMKSQKSGRVEKMSKSKGNVVNPDDMIEKFGSDALRLYMLFMGPPELDCEWQTDSLRGTHSFLQRLWSFLTNPQAIVNTEQEVSDNSRKRFHRFLKDYQERIAHFKVNTAVASCMEYLNDLQKNRFTFSKRMLEQFLSALSIMTPHYASELLETLVGKQLADCSWPVYDPKLAVVSEVNIAIQVNGKVRATLSIAKDSPRESVEPLAQELASKWLEEKTVVKIIFVPNRIVNFVVREK